MGEDFKQLTLDGAIEVLRPVRPTLVLCHVHPDGDAIGSAFALVRLLELMGSRAYCVCADRLPKRLGFLADGVQSDITPESIPEGFEDARVIAVDTASPAQLGRLYQIFGDRIDLMIDHHGVGQPYADNYIRPEAAAAGEIVYGIARACRDKGMIGRIDERIAFLLYSAVSSDTGCFRYSNVTPDTHICAAELLKLGGFDAADVNHKLFEVKTRQVMAVESEGAKRLGYFCGGRVGIITFPYELKCRLGVRDEDLETLIEIARCAEGVGIAAVVRQANESNSFRVSMRASEDFDVSDVCKVFGGGGHIRAAGCTIEADGIDGAVRMLIAEIERRL